MTGSRGRTCVSLAPALSLSQTSLTSSRYKNDVKLTGLVYLHRITDNRMAGSPYKNLRMFGNLCGDHAASRVLLVSTMWDKIDTKIAEKRESQLAQEFWKGLLEGGSKIDRLRTSQMSESWRIISALIQQSHQREVTLLQQEIVDLERNLNETQAAQVLHSDLQKLLYEQKVSIKSLLAQVEKSNDPKLKADLQKEYNKIHKQFEKTFCEVRKLKIPIGRRIALLFSFRKPSSVGGFSIVHCLPNSQSESYQDCHSEEMNALVLYCEFF